jgi:holo-[acyl-carrier protein] synthase
VASASGSASGQVVGVGVDLCEVDRMRRTLARTPGFRDRVFTEAEQALCLRRRDPSECLAARFAAKEATLKALGAGLGACPLRDVEVVRAESGAPTLRLHAGAQTLAQERGVTAWRISLTHTKTMAEAMVIALGPGRDI